MYEIVIKVDEEIIKKQKSYNIAQEKEKERQKQEEAMARQRKKTMATIREIAIMTTKELLVSKVGEYTRDSLLQRQIDVGAGVIATIGAFAIHPILGAIAVATSTASQAIDYGINMQKEQSRLTIVGGRAGYINRSR